MSTSVLRAVLVCLAAVSIAGTWTIGKAANESGEDIYDHHCKRCHGPEGRGTQEAPSLVPFEWSNEEALDLIRRPRCTMPPVPESSVSDADVAQIIAYLKTIK
jgi:mono/diheme cytochrome c family protein